MAKADIFDIDILSKMKTVHLIGVGGIGVSAIARMLLQDGKKVSGSNNEKTKITEELKKLGAKIYYKHEPKNIPKNVELIVYTAAVPATNPEMREARKRGVPVLSYPEMLGVLSASKHTIAVAGTHGKTTTTAMLAKIFKEAGLEPTAIVGSLVKTEEGDALPTNFIAGKGKHFIVEACEYRRNFLNINPNVIVITNIDRDHLDYYKDLKDIQKAFAEFAAKLPKDGFLICNISDPRLKPVIKKTLARVINYATVPSKFKLKVPGEHNISNAKAAHATARALGIGLKTVISALNKFGGTWRRFEFTKQLKSGAKLYNDYGHHPTEIEATLKAARSITGKKSRVIVVFQPHLYSRTKLLLKDFAKSFDYADQVIVTDIYAAREKNDKSIHAQHLVNEINKKSGKAIYMKKFEDIADYINAATDPGDIVILQGAGDVVKVGEIC
ncbi:MAG: UDP-N-acetylmuramate--L-alanine ligase [bacterium]